MAARFISAILVVVGFCCRAASEDLRFLPPDADCVVTFNGLTQSGKELHRFEVRELGVFDAPSGKLIPAFNGNGRYYVIYTAGTHGGPKVLAILDGGIEPMTRLARKDLIEIFYTAGAHTHIRESWRLLGHTAERISRDEINWRDDPRRK